MRNKKLNIQNPSAGGVTPSDLALKVAKSGDTMSGLLQFSGTGHAGLKLNGLTTAQRDLLSPSEGVFFWNASRKRASYYNGSTWEELSSIIRSLQGVDGYLYSHSYGNVQSPANCSANTLAQTLLSRDLFLGSMTTRSNNGYYAQDVAAVMMNGANAWTPGGTGLVMLDCSQNDLFGGVVAGVISTVGQNAFKNSLRAMLYYLRCSTVTQQSDVSFTETGTWTTLTQTWFMGGTMRQTLVQNDKVDIAVNGTDFVLFSRATSVAHGVASVKVDGSTVATIDNSAGNQGKAGAFATTTPYAVPLLNLSSGAHTVTLTKTDASASAGVYIDAIGKISTTPPQILIRKQVYLPDSRYAAWGNGATNTNVDQWNAFIDAVVAEFPSDGTIVVSDPNSNGWDRNTMTGANSSGHPNDIGNRCIADSDRKALLPLTYRSGLNVL